MSYTKRETVPTCYKCSFERKDTQKSKIKVTEYVNCYKHKQVFVAKTTWMQAELLNYENVPPKQVISCVNQFIYNNSMKSSQLLTFHL